MAGSIGPRGTADSSCGIVPRVIVAPATTGEGPRSDLVRCSMLLHPDLVLVGEQEAVGVDLELLGLLAAFPGHRVRAEQPGLLDHVDAADGRGSAIRAGPRVRWSSP